MPKCTACRLEKDDECFFRNAGRRGGRQARCKACDKARGQSVDRKRYRDRRYRDPVIRAKVIAYQAERRQDPVYIEREAERHREYRRNEEWVQRKSERELNRKWSDVQVRLAVNLRVRLCQAIKRDSKAGSAVRDLGCSIDELRVHLEALFQPGMTWDNWGRHGWHIDHVRPLSSFDLSDPEQARRACHFSNLQPLWADANLRKHARV